MIDVIEINPADGEIAQLLDRRGPSDVSKHSGLRFERERNEAAETAGFTLKLAKLTQMIDALFERLDVPVQHGTGTVSTHSMPGPVNLEPFLGCFFAAA